MIPILRESLLAARLAAKANLLPGLLLQAIMAVFLIAYLTHDGTRDFLAQISRLKQETGLWFAFVSYVVAGGVLPELLRIAFFQRGRATRSNAWRMLTSALIWGCMGMLVDGFYRLQAVWFGTGNDFWTIVCKVLVDQLLYSPFVANPLSAGLLTWRNENFAPVALRPIVSVRFYLGTVVPIQVAGWFIWLPGVSLIYFMPPELQIPVAALLQAFWTLILTAINERHRS